MLNISFQACTKVELWDLTVCNAVNGEKFQSPAVTLTLTFDNAQYRTSELFSYITMYLNFMFPNQFLLSYHAKTHTQKHTHTRIYTHTDAHIDSLWSTL